MARTASKTARHSRPAATSPNVYFSARRALYEDAPGQNPEGGCLFIAGDVAESGWSYCKADRTPGKSYCPRHEKECHKGKPPPTGRRFRLEGPKSIRPPARS